MRPTRIIAVLALGLGALALARADAGEQEARSDEGRRRPIVFVHGFSGSGAQFETQALRFTSNGFAPDLVELHDYDSLFSVESQDDVFTRLDQRIAGLLEHARADKVDLLGHSLGTRLMQEYLNSSPERAATVAHYVNLDGAIAASPPGGVPTLAIWGRGDPARKIGGAGNLYFSSQTHTQVVTSVETFEEIYTFFTGEEPETTDVLPERGDRLRLAGRALLFPENTGVENGILEVHEIDGVTGTRIDDQPEATYPLQGDGAWGPFNARAGRNYEFAIVREGAATHHLYFEPFVRSDYWIRLLTSPPSGGIINPLLEVSDRHSGMVILRYKEWWGDQGPDSDILDINGVNILNAANAPIDKRAIAIFVQDAGSDGVTNLGAPIPSFFGLPFLTGVDMFMSAADPPNDTISIASTPRGGGGRMELVNVPNWASSKHRVSVHFHEYVNP